MSEFTNGTSADTVVECIPDLNRVKKSTIYPKHRHAPGCLEKWARVSASENEMYYLIEKWVSAVRRLKDVGARSMKEEGAFLDDVMSRLGKAGFDLVTVVDAMPGGQPFGDAVVVFRVDEVLLRIVRDRSEIFVDVGSTFAPADRLRMEDGSAGLVEDSARGS